MNNIVRADQITHALRKRHKRDIFLTEVKTDSTWVGSHQRLDAVSIKPSWTQPCITGYEVKVSRSDFMADEKYVGYLPLCHRFYFACPSGLIKPEELHDSIGLIWYKAETGGLTTRKKALYRPMDELPARLLYYIVLSRTDEERHPFFSDVRELCEAWVADKELRHTLDKEVKHKLRRLYAAESSKDRHHLEQLEKDAAQLQALEAVLKKHGVYPDVEELERRLSSGVPATIVQQIRWTDRQVKSLVETLAEAQGGTS